MDQKHQVHKCRLSIVILHLHNADVVKAQQYQTESLSSCAYGYPGSEEVNHLLFCSFVRSLMPNTCVSRRTWPTNCCTQSRAAMPTRWRPRRASKSLRFSTIRSPSVARDSKSKVPSNCNIETSKRKQTHDGEKVVLAVFHFAVLLFTKNLQKVHRFDAASKSRKWAKTEQTTEWRKAFTSRFNRATPAPFSNVTN